MNTRFLALAGMAVLLIACQPAADTLPPHPPTAMELRLRDSLQQLRTDYDSLRLWEALARGRRVREWVETVPDSLESESRAEVYQYLAMLHYHRHEFLDSIAYYTQLAQLAIPIGATTQAMARQLLCRAYVAHYAWSWTEMEMLSQLGLERLSGSVDADITLKAHLLAAKGQARKQRADDRQDTIEKVRGWEESASLFSSAAANFAASGSPWKIWAYENLGVVLSRQPKEKQSQFFQVAQQVRTAASPEAARHILYDRLLGYWHYRRSNLDSSNAHYGDATSFRRSYFHYYEGEALYVLRSNYLRLGEYDRALQTNRNIFAYLNCCPEPSGSDPLACQEEIRCMFDLSEEAEILLKRYTTQGDTADLQTALRYTQESLRNYRQGLLTVSSESQFNRLVELGEQLISRALLALKYEQQRNTDFAYQDVLFRTMELGKSHLLVQDLAATIDQLLSAPGARYDLNVQQLQDRIAQMKYQYERRDGATIEDLSEFAELIARREALRTNNQRLGTEREFADAVGSVMGIEEVRRTLSSGQALLEFAEVDTSFMGLYIDSDTVINFVGDIPRKAWSENLRNAMLPGIFQPDSFNTISGQVYSELFGPVARALENKKELLLVPALSMNDLPFAALVIHTPAGAEYLVERLRLRLLDSWRVHRQNALIYAAHPIKTVPRVGVWTHPELQSYFERLLPTLESYEDWSIRHFSGRKHGSATYMEEANSFDVLHFSVHGRGNDNSLHENYLYFSAADSLNGLVIGSVPLQANLVVLAACSTARGFAGRREGVLSLRRSFHRAGVPEVISSLYDTSAPATAEIMQAFYESLHGGADPVEALAVAQRRCQAGELGQRYKQPYYWAGLVVG